MTATQFAPSRRPDRTRPPLRVVPEGDSGGNSSSKRRAISSRTARARLVVAGGIALVLLGVFGAVLAHVVLAQDQFRLEQLQTRSAQRQAEYDRLRLQVAELEAPARIVATAQQRGMVLPAGVTYLAPSQEAMPPQPTGAGSPPQSPPTSWATVKSHLAAG